MELQSHVDTRVDSVSIGVAVAATTSITGAPVVLAWTWMGDAEPVTGEAEVPLCPLVWTRFPSGAWWQGFCRRELGTFKKLAIPLGRDRLLAWGHGGRGRPANRGK